MKGKLIVFEGLDYSFKETNSKKLVEYIKENITNKVKLVSFPNYEEESSNYVKKYLNKEFGECDQVNPYEVSMYYALDRVNTIRNENIKELLEDGYYIVMDRYVGSNMIFQSAKIDNILERTEFLHWCYDFEYERLQLPKEDITLYMHMPLSISYPLMQKRKLKNNCEADGHEENYKFMKKIENSALSISAMNHWKNVECANLLEDHIYSENTLFKKVLNVLKFNKVI